MVGVFILLFCLDSHAATMTSAFCRAQQLQASKAWPEALSAYKEIVTSSDPGSWSWVQGYLGVFECLKKIEDPDTMLETSRKALAESADCPQVAAAAAFHTGEVLQSQGKPMEAIEYYRQVEREYPDQHFWYYWALFREAHVCYDHSMDDEFFAAVDKIIEDYPEKARLNQFTWACFYKTRQLRNMQRDEECCDLVEFLLDKNPYMATGEEYKPDFDLIHTCRSMLESYYKNTKAWCRGVRYADRILAKEGLDSRLRDQWQGLRKSWFEKVDSRRDLDLYGALRADGITGTTDPGLAYGIKQASRGNEAYARQRYDEALQRYQDAVEELTGNGHVLTLLAGWIRDQRFLAAKEEEAFEFVRSLVSDPSNSGDAPKAWAVNLVADTVFSASGLPATLQWYCYLGGSSDVDPTQPGAEAWSEMADVQKALEASENTADERDALLTCVGSFAKQSDYLSCNEVLKLLSGKYADDVEAAEAVRVLLEESMEEPDESQIILPAALEFADADPEILRVAGSIRWERDEFSEAIAYLRRYLETVGDTEDVQVVLMLGTALLKDGESEKGRKTLSELIEKHPDSTEAPEALYMLAQDLLASEEYAEALKKLESLLALYPTNKHVDEMCKFFSQVPDRYFTD